MTIILNPGMSKLKISDWEGLIVVMLSPFSGGGMFSIGWSYCGKYEEG